MFAKVHQFFIEFSNTTTVHGVNYFGDRKRHWIERVFWVVVFVVSMSACIFTVHKTYTKWQSSPIIVTLDDKLTAIYEIPFPAITVCPAAKIKHKLKVNLTRAQDELITTVIKLTIDDEDFKFNNEELKAMNVTENEILMLEALDHICPTTNFAVDYLVDRIAPLNLADILKMHALDSKDVIAPFTMTWKDGWIDHENSLDSILTEEGVCYSFNGPRNFDIFKENSIADDFRPYESKRIGIDWNPEDEYKGTMDKKLIPRRAFNSNPQDGLFMKVIQKSDISDTGCPLAEEMMKIVVHSPANFPRVGSNYIIVPFNEKIVITVKPTMMKTSLELKKYPVATRQCYFNSDRSLQFFKYYSQSNCKFECLTNFTLLACGCVRVTMPRDNSTRICMLEDKYCVIESEKIFRAKSLEDLDDRVISHIFDSEIFKRMIQYSCDCLPSCMSLSYEISTSKSPFRNDPDKEFPESVIMVHFEDAQFLKAKRSEIYGWGDFIANCGGLLGLFLGVSILSIIEIIYFATVRLACTMNVTKNNVVAIESGAQNRPTPAFERTLRLQLLEWDRY